MDDDDDLPYNTQRISER